MGFAGTSVRRRPTPRARSGAGLAATSVPGADVEGFTLAGSEVVAASTRLNVGNAGSLRLAVAIAGFSVAVWVTRRRGTAGQGATVA
jgi:hypothetical protein